MIGDVCPRPSTADGVEASAEEVCHFLQRLQRGSSRSRIFRHQFDECDPRDRSCHTSSSAAIRRSRMELTRRGKSGATPPSLARGWGLPAKLRRCARRTDSRLGRAGLVQVCSNEDNHGPSPERRARTPITPIPLSTRAVALQLPRGPSLPAPLGDSRKALRHGRKGMALDAAARRRQSAGPTLTREGAALVASGMLMDGAAARSSRSGGE